MIEKVYQNADDDRVAIRKVYAKTDGYAYLEKDCKTKVSCGELHDAFIKGLLVVDASDNEYKTVSCFVTKDVATVTYVTADSSAATTAKLATVKSK